MLQLRREAVGLSSRTFVILFLDAKAAHREFEFHQDIDKKTIYSESKSFSSSLAKSLEIMHMLDQ
jgi:hypothetical protein